MIRLDILREAAPGDFVALLETEELPGLGPRVRRGVLSEGDLRERLGSVLDGARIGSSLRRLLTSAALLWHDHLDASHAVSQDIPSADGSFLHGIMHRREPDYGNAKYWFRRVGAHPAFPAIAEQMTAWGGRDVGDFVRGDAWDPFAFVDAVEEAAADAERARELREVQRIEFEVLVASFFGG